MAESMQGLKRSHRCAEVSNALEGQKVTVMGWVQKSRNKGGIIFVDLRDRSGILQLIFEEADCGAESFAKAEKLRSEFVIAVTGRVEARSGAVNENLKTGAIEIRADYLRILAESETPPFPIEEDSKTREELRLKYRYLDLRRPDIQRNLMTRSRVAILTRAFLAEEGFLEIETPTLIKSTPEGARDYLVPSRVHPGSFYALPQSPQLLKQLLMCSGYDRYFQLARCYRDEDLRADRQPEFTQIDMELSFVDVEDVLDVNERLLKKLFKEICNYDLQLPIQRMTWREAMDRFGSDKPDLRFGMELKNVSDVVKDCEFVVFKSALENGGSVRGINAEGQGAMPRKKIDALVEYAKGFGAKGLAYIAIHEDGSWKSSFSKFMTEEQMEALIKAMDGQAGDLLLFAADRNKIVWNVLGALRLELAKQSRYVRANEEIIQSQEEKIKQQDTEFANNSDRIFKQGDLIEEQREELQQLTLRIEDVETLLDEVSSEAYDKAVDKVAEETMRATRKDDIRLAEDSKRWIQSPERKASRKEKEYAINRLDGLIKKIEYAMEKAVVRVVRQLKQPEKKKAVVEEIKKEVKPSIREKLALNVAKIQREEAERKQLNKGKSCSSDLEL